MKRPGIKEVLVFIFGLFIAFVMIEVMMRVFPIYTTVITEPHPQYGWRNIPNFGEWHFTTCREFNNWIQFNSKGLRDYEYDYGRQDGKKRILVLGDSFMAGLHVPFENTTAKQLEQRINSDAGVEEAYEVINAGVGGYSTANELLYYTHEGYKYEPDIVMLFLFSGNDVIANHYRSTFFVANPDSNLTDEEIRQSIKHTPFFVLSNGSLELENYPSQHYFSENPLKVLARRHCKSCFMVYDLFLRFEETVSEEKKTVSPYLPEYPDYMDEAWVVTEKLLLQLKKETDSRGSRLVVVYIPMKYEIGQGSLEDESLDLGKPARLISEICSRNGLDFLDLTPGLEEIFTGTGKKTFFDCDGHMNEIGNAFAARASFEHLKSEALI